MIIAAQPGKPVTVPPIYKLGACEIEITKSDRGFHMYGQPVPTSYGDEVTVSESSAAIGPHCWLRIEGSAHVDPSSHNPSYDNSMGGKHVYERASSSAHLTVEQAEDIIARLQAWVDEVPERWSS